MKFPTIPRNEAERLAALRDYDVLDSPEEEGFDALTRLAAGILGVPIALISLIDADRQWFKSHYGLAVRETPRDHAFCGHVVGDGVALVVPDAAADPRFADNPLVVGVPRVAFYAGVPLRAPDGFLLGTFCAIDHLPRELSALELEQLELLAKLTMQQLEARRRSRQLAAERAIALENNRRLAVLFDAMVEGVVVQLPGGHIVSANPAAERLLGLPLAQIIGGTSLDPRGGAVRDDESPFPGHEHPAMVALETGRPQVDVVMGVHRPDGSLTWISVNALPLSNEGEAKPHAAVTTFHDVSEHRAAQRQAQRIAAQERLITTGTLAAGVGHEINTPLASVMANLDYLLEELPGGGLERSELCAVLGEVKQGADRIQRIVRSLRSLARSEAEPSRIDAADAVEIAVQMSAHETKSKATVVVELGTTPPLLVDESRLCQVLVNLIVNAAQAFPTAALASNQIRITAALIPDGRLAIAVADNGPGIPPEVQKRIFDPFFTTKPVGQALGLGLPISQSSVHALGGELQVDSRVGRGTVFRVVLPLDGPPARPAPGTRPSPAAIAAPGEPAVAPASAA